MCQKKTINTLVRLKYVWCSWSFVSKYVSIVFCWLNLVFFLFLGVWTIHRHENWQTHWFLMQIFYIFCYTLVYLNNMWVPIENKPAPGDHEFNFKLCCSIGLRRKCRKPICTREISKSCVQNRFSVFRTHNKIKIVIIVKTKKHVSNVNINDFWCTNKSYSFILGWRCFYA